MNTGPSGGVNGAAIRGTVFAMPNLRVVVAVSSFLLVWTPVALGQATPLAPRGERAVAPQPGVITLERIMSDPDWIGRSPEAAVWSADGSRVIFDQKREGSTVRDRFAVEPGGDPVLVGDAERAGLYTADGEWSGDGSRRVLSRDGDIVILDRAGRATVLTRTSERESSPFFVNGRDAVAYRRGGGWVVHDLANGVVRDAAEVRFSEDPDEKDEPKRSFLEEQQRRYFRVLVDDERERDAREDAERERAEADPDRVPGPFYIGKNLERRGDSLSPDARTLAVWAGEPGRGGERRDVMPAYVTDDGYVRTSSVRPKVGVERASGQRLFLLDLVERSHVEIDLTTLPGLTDDPFAFLAEAKVKADEETVTDGVDAAHEAGAHAGAEPAGDTTDETESRESSEPDPATGKGTPRPFTVMRSDWSPDGRYLAVMLESGDNKDRWIVVVDREAPETPVVVEHQRDDAWINWSFNEMAFLRHPPTGEPTLWFLSEASGFSHLHTWTPGSEHPTQHTDGSFEISAVSEHPINGSLYFRMNRDTPVEYEVGRWLWNGNGGGVLDAVTDLDGTVESFELSPDGTRLLLNWSSAIEPPDLYLADAEPNADSGAEVIRLTDTVSAEYRSVPWIEPEIVEVPSSVHGRPIWTKVYRVPGAWKGAGDPPGVVFVHGAGYTQNSDDEWPYYFREQMFHSLLAHRGYVIADPDYRASAGYGRDWRTAIYRRMGEPELEDLRDVVGWMDETHNVDSSRVGVYGGSYGGFMTLYAMFRDPQLFACGAALRPVTDWAHYNHGYTANILNTPELDPDAFAVSSPIEFAEGLENPLLICHGMLDDNVVFQDTVRLAQRLIELGKTDWEVAMYPAEPHGFVHPSSWLDEYRRIETLFRRNLEASPSD